MTCGKKTLVDVEVILKLQIVLKSFKLIDIFENWPLE